VFDKSTTHVYTYILRSCFTSLEFAIELAELAFLQTHNHLRHTLNTW